MLKLREKEFAFPQINAGYDAVFNPDRLSIGLVAPVEAYPSSPVPELDRHLARIQLAEALGFPAIWLRDVPFNVPSFGDAGQIFDPFVYLGALAASTSTIALGVASIILPLRHPAHVAKAAASVDVLSDGRLILGIASGDRPEEYPALDIPFEKRGELFRESFAYIRQMSVHAPRFCNAYGRVSNGMDMLPNPHSGNLPLLATGSSQQSTAWIAANCDGWMTYPRPVDLQDRLIKDFRRQVALESEFNKPVMEPLYIDLAADPDTPPSPIHLGMRLGVNALRAYLETRENIGVNHVALNLRFNRADIEQTLHILAKEILPDFTS